MKGITAVLSASLLALSLAGQALAAPVLQPPY